MDVISRRIRSSLLPLPVPGPLCSSSCHQDTVGFWADFWLLLALGFLSEPPKSTDSSETDWQGTRFKSEQRLQDKTVYIKPWHPLFFASMLDVEHSYFCVITVALLISAKIMKTVWKTARLLLRFGNSAIRQKSHTHIWMTLSILCDSYNP